MWSTTDHYLAEGAPALLGLGPDSEGDIGQLNNARHVYLLKVTHLWYSHFSFLVLTVQKSSSLLIHILEGCCSGVFFVNFETWHLELMVFNAGSMRSFRLWKVFDTSGKQLYPTETNRGPSCYHAVMQSKAAPKWQATGRDFNGMTKEVIRLYHSDAEGCICYLSLNLNLSLSISTRHIKLILINTKKSRLCLFLDLCILANYSYLQLIYNSKHSPDVENVLCVCICMSEFNVNLKSVNIIQNS